MSQSKRTCTSQALTRDYIYPFDFTVKWDLFGFYITGERKGFGYPNHANHRNKGDLSKLFLPTQLIPKRKNIHKYVSDACLGAMVGHNYVFAKLG
jgi:hypothetical protein